MESGGGGGSALPPLGGLSLRPAREGTDRLSLGAATGKFYALPDPEAQALNADGGREVLTHNEYPVNRERDNEGATFRLFWDHNAVRRRNPPGHESQEETAARNAAQYAVYDAAALWAWLKSRPNDIDAIKDPTNSFSITQEDWMALYERYDGYSSIPEWVSFLVAVEFPDFGPDTTWVKPENHWEAYVDGALRFKSSRHNATQSPTVGSYYAGPAGEERLVRKIVSGKEWKRYTGPKGQEHEIEWHDRGVEVWYRSPHLDPPLPNPPLGYQDDEGRMLRIEFLLLQEVWHFRGRAGMERTARKEKDNTVNGRMTEYYKGGHWLEHTERLVEIHYHDLGKVEYFKGSPDHERLWKSTHRDGRVKLFRGYKGSERLERTQFPDGRVEYNDDIET